jgi:hypothetical protein
MQAAPDIAADEFGAYRKISDRIGKRLVKPVLPLPLTPDEKAHNARVTASSSMGDK